MKVKISNGNTKLGGTMNISLPPGLSCRTGIPCFNDGCYARKSYRMYPNVKRAWDHNYDLYHTDPEEYFDSISDEAMKADFFRWHVSGDIINQKYFDGMVDVAEMEVLTKFLVFTKKYDLDFSEAPDNLQVVLSTWPGLELPEDESLLWAWLLGDVRRDTNAMYLICPGNCEQCGHKCWTLLQHNIDVVFPKH